MDKMKWLWGLPTIEPSTQTVGAALSVGIKPKGGGWPEEKDRFHVVTAKTRERKEMTRKGERSVDYRPHDPRFAAFNGADLETRKVFYGVLCYHAEQECWHPNYMMHRFPAGRGVNPKTKRGACHGNGTTAERFFGEGDVREIDCPGEGCPFRQPFKEGNPPPCMPRARFWFRPRWIPSQGKASALWMPDGSIKELLPKPIMRLATQGREARDTFAGLLKDVREAAEPVGVEIKSWMGLPFSITLSESRQAPGVHPGETRGRRWPDITFALDGDWMEWIGWQSRSFKMLAAGAPEMGSASDAERDPELVGSEHLAIVPDLMKPAAVAKPPEDVIDVEPEPAADPRSHRQRIREEYAGGGFSMMKVTTALRSAGILGPGEAFSKVPRKRLDEVPWPKIADALDSFAERMAQEGLKRQIAGDDPPPEAEP